MAHYRKAIMGRRHPARTGVLRRWRRGDRGPESRQSSSGRSCSGGSGCSRCIRLGPVEASHRGRVSKRSWSVGTVGTC